MENEDGVRTPKVVWKIDVGETICGCGCILLFMLIFAGPYIVEIINAIKK